MAVRARPAPRPPGQVRVAWARFAARHPEWWAVGLALGAWAVLLGSTLWWSSDTGVGWVHTGHDHRPAADPGSVPPPAPPALVASAVAWLVMIAAMMVPVLVPRLRLVAAYSIGRIRTQAVAQTLAGDLLVWAAVGVPVVAATSLLPPVAAATSPVAFVGIWLMVVGWQLLPPKSLALRRCHAVQVPAGLRDGRRRVIAGADHARWCVVSCGPAMLAMAVTGHSLLFMGVLTVGLVAERVAHRPALAVRGLAAVVAAAALVTVVVGLPG